MNIIAVEDRKDHSLKHSSRFKVILAFYGFYILGDFLGGSFVLQNNKVALVLIVLIPTILLLAYISMVVHSVQPRKKKIPRRASRLKVVGR